MFGASLYNGRSLQQVIDLHTQQSLGIAVLWHQVQPLVLLFSVCQSSLALHFP